MPRFGHAELLDDIIDHWDAKTHRGERAAFVERLQAVAKAREARVSFVSGDVHVGGIGRFYTRPKVLRTAPLHCGHVCLLLWRHLSENLLTRPGGTSGSAIFTHCCAPL